MTQSNQRKQSTNPQAITAAQFNKLKSQHAPSRREQPETAIRRAITDFLRLHGWKVARIVQSALSERGIPDLVAIRAGETVWIEVKTPRGRLSPYQAAWLDELAEHGGRHIVARSVEDVEHLAGGGHGGGGQHGSRT